MRADIFFPRMIRIVIAIGIASAFLVIGEDVMEPGTDEVRVASSDGKQGPSLVDPSALVPPTNGTDESEDDDGSSRVSFALP